MQTLKCFLVDDGTLDTVIEVIGSEGTKVFRFNFDDYDAAQTREEQITQAMKCAEEDYFD